jgi:hypothetical protein
LLVNPFFHIQTKYIKIDYHFVHERVANKLLSIKFLSNKDQIVDRFTKALAVKDLNEFKRNLNISQGCKGDC